MRGLDLGADDYLTQLLDIDELLARVRAVLRRTHFREDERALFTTMIIGQFTIDFGQRQVMLADQKVVLTPTEYHLLAAPACYARRILPPDALLEQIWGKEYVGEHHLLQVNINRLRHKLEPDSTHSRPGIGYVLAPQMQEPGTS